MAERLRLQWPQRLTRSGALSTSTPVTKIILLTGAIYLSVGQRHRRDQNAHAAGWIVHSPGNERMAPPDD
jgi:hypothetical protein